MIRVVLPHHLRKLANVTDEVQIDLDGPVAVRSLLDALEQKYPVLRGTVREHETLQRRPLVRFFADGEDISHEPADTLLSETVTSGAEPFFIIGAIAGG